MSRILFIADAGPTVGGGHVMRSLTLARALIERGVDCAFWSSPHVEPLLAAFGGDQIQRHDGDPRLGYDYDLIVFDHYGLNAADHLAMAAGRPVLVIDDLADRPLGADLVLDAGPDRHPPDYAGLTPPGARLLLGPAFAPVRPQFAALRTTALARRRRGSVRRVLVSLGLTDVGAITQRAIGAISNVTGDADLDVVIGADAPSLPRLRALAAKETRLHLHEQSRSMAELTLHADLAIGAGGSTAWERCTLGLPSVLVILADNQVPAALALERRGAVLTADARQPAFAARLAEATAQLMHNAELRSAMASKAAAVCDGEGADRSAEAVMALVRGGLS